MHLTDYLDGMTDAISFLVYHLCSSPALQPDGVVQETLRGLRRVFSTHGYHI
jgi:hypothetical protein